MIFKGRIFYKIKENFDVLKTGYDLSASFYSLEDLYNLYEGKNSKYRFVENTGGFNNPNRVIVSVVLSKDTQYYLDSLSKNNT
jgi:hypothetical protein